MKNKINLSENSPMPLDNEDVIEGMRKLGGYYAITPNDFRELYQQIFHFAKERILTKTTAEDIMSAPVLSISDEKTLAEAISLMAEKNISGLPVVNTTGQPLGILSEKDIIKQIDLIDNTSPMQVLDRIINKSTPCLECMASLKVSDAMSTPMISAEGTSTLKDLIQKFQDYKINRLPIVGEDQKLIGIVSRTDLINAYSLFL